MVEEQAAAAVMVEVHHAEEGREAENEMLPQTDQAVDGFQPSDQPDSTQYQNTISNE